MSLKNTVPTASWNKSLVVTGVATVAAAAVIGVLFLMFGHGKSVAALAGELQSRDAHTRHLAARQLAKFGAQAKDAVPQLTEALRDSDKSVRHYAAKTLAEVGIEAKSATADLIADLADPDPETRYYVVKALSKVELDKTHAHAVPGLIKTLKEKPEDALLLGQMLEGNRSGSQLRDSSAERSNQRHG